MVIVYIDSADSHLQACIEMLHGQSTRSMIQNKRSSAQYNRNHIAMFEPNRPFFHLRLVYHPLGETSLAPILVRMALNNMDR